MKQMKQLSRCRQLSSGAHIAPGSISPRAAILYTAVLLATTLATGASAEAGDWPQWRGPNRNGVAEAGQGVPAEWSDSANIVWKTDVPGRGHASPTIVGNLIVLATADEQAQVQGVVAFDRTGIQKWITPVNKGGLPELHAKNTHASSTLASDGRLFFVVFHHHDKLEAAALDPQGTIVWRRDVGPFRPQVYKFGYAASPTIHQQTLIVTGNCDTSSWMKALDTETGKIMWEQEMPRGLLWSSPIVASVAGRSQLLLSGFEKMSAFDPDSGGPLWSTPCLTQATCGTAVWEGDIVFASGGFPKSETVAVRADGTGTVLWKNEVKCYEQSMLVTDGHLYAFSDTGIAYCWDAATGTERWKSRLKGPVSASPILVGDLIFASNESGTTFVFRADPGSYQQVARNQLGDESFATPSVADNRMYLRVASSAGGRRQESLVCIGEK